MFYVRYSIGPWRSPTCLKIIIGNASDHAEVEPLSLQFTLTHHLTHYTSHANPNTSHSHSIWLVFGLFTVAKATVFYSHVSPYTLATATFWRLRYCVTLPDLKEKHRIQNHFIIFGERLVYPALRPFEVFHCNSADFTFSGPFSWKVLGCVRVYRCIRMRRLNLSVNNIPRCISLNAKTFWL
jgi:hypothetical protein